MSHDRSSDIDLLRFAIAWGPYGGARDDDIFIENGLTPPQYYTRLADLLATLQPDELPLGQANLVREQCIRPGAGRR
jgi:hypothetical protein